MKTTNTCVVIPIYNELPKDNEILSICRNIDVLKDYDIYAVYPDGMNVDQYCLYGITNYVPFNKKYFISNKTYSRLVLSDSFYSFFNKYDYMLIAQTDTYILNTNYSLDFFVNLKYDYYGAPWPEGPFNKPYRLREYLKCLFVRNSANLHVGNGGFSLRKIDATLNLVKKHKFYIKYIWRLNEDLFFSIHGRKGGAYTSCPIDVASQFALETNMQSQITKGNIPYAVHAWEKYLTQNIDEINVE